MMPGSNDYDPVADLYDAYVRVDFDLEFFGGAAARCAGPVLELMAGTGRVSRAIHEANSRLTCLDLSLDMLRVLKSKLADVSPAPSVLCGDIRALPLRSDEFGLAVIPFNSFAELTAMEDRRAALREIQRVLVPGGELICTLHNPAVRARSLDGHAQLLGSYDLDPDKKLEVWVRGVFDSATNQACSHQTYRVYGATGALQEEREQEVRFALIGADSFRDVVAAAGFGVAGLVGDYDGSVFDAAASPYMIWTLRKD